MNLSKEQREAIIKAAEMADLRFGSFSQLSETLRSLLAAPAADDVSIAKRRDEAIRILRYLRDHCQLDRLIDYSLTASEYEPNAIFQDIETLLGPIQPTPEDAPSIAQGVALTDEQHEREVSQLIDERDSFEHMCTALADKVAELLDAEVGEWSNANNPVFRAIHLIEDQLAAAKPASVDAQPASGVDDAQPTDMQICAMGACASLAESMGNDSIAIHVREFLAAREKARIAQRAKDNKDA